MEIEENGADDREEDIRVFEGFQNSPESIRTGSGLGRQVQQKNDERKSEQHVDEQRDQVGDHVIEDRQKNGNADIGNVPVKAADAADDQRGLTHAEDGPVNDIEEKKNRGLKKDHREREAEVENIMDVRGDDV